jgi:site-specific DNA-cytosine methylase
MELTHASWFSGVGGLDMGLERAGFRTVSFSEIDPYASAVLEQRWPGVPNLGSIVDVVDGRGIRQPAGGEGAVGQGLSLVPQVSRGTGQRPDDWQHATLWTGGFPCQDLSVAGKRRGFGNVGRLATSQLHRSDGSSSEPEHRGTDDRSDGMAGSPTRSGLAFAFLELVGRYRPPIVLLENVPGLLSSHGGRDMAALLGALVELGYGVGYRVLDARHFGVPQRRRRVFIVGVTPGGRAGAERAAEVLSVGSRCRRHPPTGVEAGEDAAAGTGDGVAGTLQGPTPHNGWPNGAEAAADGYLQVAQRPPPHPDGVRAPDGLAGRAHDSGGVAATLNSGGNQGGFRTEPGEHLVAHYRKSTRAASSEHDETWVPDDVTNTLNGFDVGDARAVELVTGQGGMTEDPLLPLGLDSHRYRCCGNGVVADVAEWLGWRLRALLEDMT